MFGFIFGLGIQAWVFHEEHLVAVLLKYAKILAFTDLGDYFDSDFKDKRD